MNALEKFVHDLVNFGTRSDLNPTLNYATLQTAAESHLHYLQRIDKSIRERAQDALEQHASQQADTCQYTVPEAPMCAACGLSAPDVHAGGGLPPGWSVTVVLSETPTPIHDAVMARFEFVVHCSLHTD